MRHPGVMAMAPVVSATAVMVLTQTRARARAQAQVAALSAAPAVVSALAVALEPAYRVFLSSSQPQDGVGTLARVPASAPSRSLTTPCCHAT